MILIWLPKVYLARALNSSTMQGEATCSLSCIQITVVLFVGALVYRVWKGGWWVDDATSLVLGLMFGREGYNMLQWVRDPSFDGGCCKTCKTPKLPIEDPEAGSVYLEESYKDLCGCCVEKTECKAAGSCVCGHGQESNSRSVSVRPPDHSWEGKVLTTRRWTRSAVASLWTMQAPNVAHTRLGRERNPDLKQRPAAHRDAAAGNRSHQRLQSPRYGQPTLEVEDSIAESNAWHAGV
jgi:hypothetical protein